AGVLGEAVGHERRGFLVTYTNIANTVGALAQHLEHGIDAVTDNPKSVPRSPRDPGLDQNVSGRLVAAELEAAVLRSPSRSQSELRPRWRGPLAAPKQVRPPRW